MQAETRTTRGIRIYIRFIWVIPKRYPFRSICSSGWHVPLLKWLDKQVSVIRSIFWKRTPRCTNTAEQWRSSCKLILWRFKNMFVLAHWLNSPIALSSFACSLRETISYHGVSSLAVQNSGGSSSTYFPGGISIDLVYNLVLLSVAGKKH